MGEKERLEDMYLNQFLSVSKISQKIKKSRTQIFRLLKKYKIKTRNGSECKLIGKKKPTKEELYDLYWVQHIPSYKIGKMFNVYDNTINRWLREYNIPTKGLSESKFQLKISKKELGDLYLKQKLSTCEIAEKFGLKKDEYVRRKLIHYGIERRDSIEVRSIIVNLKPSPELAYVLGVMKGDGSVFPDNTTVCLGVVDLIFAESFKKALIRLGFNADIKKYKKKEKIQHKQQYHTRANSKQFCLWYKKLSLNDIEDFVSKDEEMIKEFIRGFYESEGCGRAYIGLSNSNKELLEIVQRLLNRLGFTFKISKGHKDKRNPNWKKMYEIYNYEHDDYFRFFELIKPLIKIYENYVQKDFNEAIKLFKSKNELDCDIKLTVCKEKGIRELIDEHYPIKIEKTPPLLTVHHSEKNKEILFCPELTNKIYGFNDKKLNMIVFLHEFFHCIQSKRDNNVDLNKKQAISDEEFVNDMMDKQFPKENEFLKEKLLKYYGKNIIKEEKEKINCL